MAKIKRPPEPSEYQIQRNVFMWAKIMSHHWPELKLLNASANGAIIQGPNKWGIINRLKESGCLKNGWPDIHLPVSRCGYYALFIELKRSKGGEVSEDQKQVLRELSANGNYACICKGEAATKRIILSYLQGDLSWQKENQRIIN